MPALTPRVDAVLHALLACASGALLVLGFAPFGWSPLALIGLLGLLAALHAGTPRDGLLRGWLFGVGLMGFGVFWVRISLNEFGNMDAWVAHLLAALFVGLIALFFGLFGWLLRRLDPGRPWVVPILLFPGLYVLVEWLRGWLFTGFPWLGIGYTQIDGPLRGYAPVFGVYGVGLLTVLSAGLLWMLLRPGTTWRPRALVALSLSLIWVGGLLLQRAEWTERAGAPIRAAVLQANIPQAMKWDPEQLVSTMEIYWDLTERNLDADLVVWPETAIPEFLHEVRPVLIDPMSQRARAEGVEIVLGIPIMDSETGRYFNALMSVGSREDLYAKRHLVPFGEFLPFAGLLGPLVDLFEVPMSGFSRGEAVRPLLTVGERTAGVSICYEAAFPAEVSQALPDAEFLINVSNDAWFGDSLAPHQHLEMARMRALENGRDLLRATNTGISAIIDARGQPLGIIPSFVRGDLALSIQPRAGATPYARVGNAPAILAAGFLVLLGVVLGPWHQARPHVGSRPPAGRPRV
jgi:apolipoprotein N-acyltransferase